MGFKFYILCLVVILNTGCIRFVKHDSAKESVNQTSQKSVTHHRVSVGETLYSIAFAYGRDHRDLARWNKIRKPYTIYPKQKLRIIPVKSDKVAKVQTTRTIITKAPTVKAKKINHDKTVYVSNSKLRWQWPTKGKVVSTFYLRDPGRRGIDLVGKKGQPIKSAAEGRVVYRGNGLRGYGNLIIIKHNETFFSAYAHTEGVVVKENEKVKLGQHIADMGSTSSEKTKLHFEIRRNGKPVNPIKYLPKRR